MVIVEIQATPLANTRRDYIFLTPNTIASI